MLSPSELACAFDLPSHSVPLVEDSSLLKHLFPLKLLSEPLQFVLEGLASTRLASTRRISAVKASRKDICDSTRDSDVSVKAVAPQFAKLAAAPNLRHASSLEPLLLSGIPNPAGPGVPGKRIWFRDPPRMTWLPELGKFLPDTWCDESLISAKAVKSDDDPVPEHLWTNRITLVIPSATNSKGFQLLALLWQRKYMYRQFRRYLDIRHGADWPQHLANIRRRTAQVAIQATKPPPRKRCRGGHHRLFLLQNR